MAAALTVGAALESLTIGTAREVTATVLFFDIENSTYRTPSSRSNDLRVTLATLNCVIPMMSRVITDHGGYIEKNTGDGLMAVFGPGDSSADDIGSVLVSALSRNAKCTDFSTRIHGNARNP